MTTKYVLLKSIWPVENCQEIIKAGLALPPVEAKVGGGSGDGGTVDSDKRRSTIRWLPWRYEQGWYVIYKKVKALIEKVNANEFQFDLSHLLDLQFTQYNADVEGVYHMHCDTNWATKAPLQRKLSIVIQLSDPASYDGCDFELAETLVNPMAMREQGTAIIFPSPALHRVTPCKGGVRWSLVAWMEGPRWK